MRYNIFYYLIYFSLIQTSALALEIAPDFVTLGNNLSGRKLPIFSSQRLSASEKVKKIVIVIHGLKRNAGDYFRMVSQIAPRDTQNETLILAPQFLNHADKSRHKDELPRRTLVWKKSEWKDGQSSFYDSLDDPTTSSFAVMDELLLLLKSLYPNLQNIVFASHSAGSQFLQRYAALTQIDTQPSMQNIHLRFLVSDPSSYLYFDQERPTKAGNFKAVDLEVCPDANSYHYGLNNPIAYGSGRDASNLRQRYFAQDVRYLLGTKDNDPNDPVMDKRCGAMAQGDNRLSRGLNYVEYLKRLGKKSPVYLIEGADHDGAHAGAKIYHSKIGQQLIFGN